MQKKGARKRGRAERREERRRRNEPAEERTERDESTSPHSSYYTSQTSECRTSAGNARISAQLAFQGSVDVRRERRRDACPDILWRGGRLELEGRADQVTLSWLLHHTPTLPPMMGAESMMSPVSWSSVLPSIRKMSGMIGFVTEEKHLQISLAQFVRCNSD